MVIARNVGIKIILNEFAGRSLTNVMFQLARETNFSCIMKKVRNHISCFWEFILQNMPLMFLQISYKEPVECPLENYSRTKVNQIAFSRWYAHLVAQQKISFFSF